MKSDKRCEQIYIGNNGKIIGCCKKATVLVLIKLKESKLSFKVTMAVCQEHIMNRTIYDIYL